MLDKIFLCEPRNIFIRNKIFSCFMAVVKYLVWLDKNVFLKTKMSIVAKCHTMTT